MRSSRLNPIFLAAYFLILNGCAANSPAQKPYAPPTKVNHTLGGWDHDKIRQVRETEAAVADNDIAPPVSNTKSCLVLSAEELRRSKATGCTPIDPRAGHGENAFCCPESQEE